MQAGRHMAAVELRLPVSRRFLCLGRITSCWVPLRGDAFKAAALGAAGATSGDRLHTLPQALHFFSLSLLSGSLPPVFFGVWINFSSFSCRLSAAPRFHRFSGQSRSHLAAAHRRRPAAAATATKFRFLFRFSEPPPHNKRATLPPSLRFQQWISLSRFVSFGESWACVFR